MYKNLSVLALLLIAGPALAEDPRCDIGGNIKNAEAVCPGPDYLTFTIEKDGNNCPKGDEVDCLPPPQPPGFERIDCYFDGSSSYSCEAWPQGELTYVWSTGSGLSVMDPGPNQSPFQHVECVGVRPGGLLRVTITSPYGLSSSGHVQLSCRDNQEY